MQAVMVNLRCITNMHVGSGDVNYNIIDNEVERDPITGYPTIYSSGVKGALREYFSQNEDLKAKVDDFFGSDKKENNCAGKLKIMGADLLAMPVRASAGNEAYYMVVTEGMLRKYRETCEIFDIPMETLKKEETIAKNSDCAVENIKLERFIEYGLAEKYTQKLYLMEEAAFRKIDLPVIARNKLENGISQNLWYEEVVPHESVFHFIVTVSESDRAVLKDFSDCIDGKVIQFGGNASIGYGFCKVTVIAGRGDGSDE